MNRIKYIAAYLFCAILLQNSGMAQVKPLPALRVSDNKRYFVTAGGEPFFWLGDTGWLLFTKLDRKETIQYLDNRKERGFNVIQVMVIHDQKHAVNRYGDSALVNSDVSRPKTTPGKDIADATQYDFWDHVDFVITEAEKRGIYIALVPVWGSNVKAGLVSVKQAKEYAGFLANRYRNQSNIIWLNGGDLMGTERTDVWEAIGSTIRSTDKNHLQSFHPRGRYSSSAWFHNSSWLDFNMFQSGHKDYAQDTSAPYIGEDNWKYAEHDYALKPVKPMMDGEPSYEKIPHGLHDSLAPVWHAADIRRYGYWSVLSGGAGFVYGHNAVMQFHNGIGVGDYFCRQKWDNAIKDSGAAQMQYLKKLMLSKPPDGRIPDPEMILNQGNKYNHLAAIKGKDYAFVYTYTGRNIQIQLGRIAGDTITASWYEPSTGKYTEAGTFVNKGTKEFDPPGKETAGNDWVLVLAGR